MTRMRQTSKGEEGFALVLVIIVLLMSALMVPPLLAVSYSGVRAAQIGEGRVQRLHAADAGIDDATYQIMHKLEGGSLPTTYILADDLNECMVDVTIGAPADAAYPVKSKATDLKGVVTSIAAIICSNEYQFITDYALLTNGDVDMQPGSAITGDVRYQYEGPLPDPSIKGTIDGDVVTDAPVVNWPQSDYMKEYYWKDVVGLEPQPSYNISRAFDHFGPLYLYDGGGLVHLTSEKEKRGVMDGTLYVRGDLQINLATGSYIDLAGQTLFVEGDVSMQPGTPFLGPGCIVATGDIQFQPQHLNPDFILVLSLEGTITAQPNGDFHGCLAARDEIVVRPSVGAVNEGTPPGTMHFPGYDNSDTRVVRVASYTIEVE